jgi:hypothetical protein
MVHTIGKTIAGGEKGGLIKLSYIDLILGTNNVESHPIKSGIIIDTNNGIILILFLFPDFSDINYTPQI